MPKGLSLHIGINKPGLPPGNLWPDLRVAEDCATRMCDLAKSLQYTPTLLLGPQATAGSILTEIQRAASKLSSGDIFFITYAGHGAQIPPLIPTQNGKDDQVWVVYDRMLRDKELYKEWSGFNNIRIVLFSDSCHNGTISSILTYLAKAIYASHEAIYDEIRVIAPDTPLSSTVLSITASNDTDETSAGYFTNNVLDVWANNGCRSSYVQFFNCLKAAMARGQETPCYRVIPKANPTFEQQSPLIINALETMQPEAAAPQCRDAI